MADAGKLAKLIDRFRQEPDGWRDDVLIAEMIELAKKTGDVTRVPISLPAMTFQQANFWTSHFGGVYIFRDVRFPAVISTLDWQSLGEVPIAQVMDLTHRNQIADWLERNGLVEPIVQARGMDAAAILRQKMDFILVDAADRLGIEIGRCAADRVAQDRLSAGDRPCRRNSWAWRRCCAGWRRGGLAEDHLGASGLFLHAARASRAGPRSGEHAAGRNWRRWTCGRCSSSTRSCSTPSMPRGRDRKKTYVADFLAREYQVDREGARTALFGPEPGMDELQRPQMAEGPKPVRSHGRPVVRAMGRETLDGLAAACVLHVCGADDRLFPDLASIPARSGARSWRRNGTPTPPAKAR